MKKISGLLGYFQHHCRQVPVLGFNSTCYDLNLVKSYLIPWLRKDVAPDADVTTTDISVIKNGSSYIQIGAWRFKFLDITNYLLGGVSNAKLLKAYKIQEAKRYFPHKWFDNVTKLDYLCLSPYQAFHSERKQRNVLEIKDGQGNDDDDIDDNQAKVVRTEEEVGVESYRDLQAMWQKKYYDHVQRLIFYNNLDVGPFVQTMEKMQTFYFHCNIDVFKVAVSVPGIVCQMLFQTAHQAKVSFGLIHTKDDNLYYTIKPNFIGGPSIIFTQDAEVGGTFIWDDPTRPCNSIVEYNANALYLDCIDKFMSCGGTSITVLLILDQIPDSMMLTCITGWITRWGKYKLDPICWMDLTPSPKQPMNTMDVISMVVLPARRMKLILGENKNNTQKSKNNTWRRMATRVIWEHEFK